MKTLQSLATVLMVVLPLTSSAAPAARPGGTAPPKPPAVAPPRPAAAPPRPARPSALQAPLPDTTMARIFFGKGRADVTLSQMRVGAYKLGAHPDSLTPQETGRVLDLLVQQAILTHRVHQEPRHWNHSDSTDYRVLTDRLTLSAALDSALAEQGFRMAARGDSVPGREELGIIVRDSSLASLHPVYDETMFQQLAAGFAAMPRPDMTMPTLKRVEMSAALPTVLPEDSARTLVSSSVGSVTVGQLLTDMGRISPTRRPAVRGLEDLRDLCKSKLYENMLREAVREQDLVHRPRIARQLAERAEYLDVQRFVATQVYDKVPLDSASLRRHFESVPDRFLAPARATVVRTLLDKREDADSLARKLTLPGFAESLTVQSSRAGIPYRTVLDEGSDSVLFGRMRNGGIGSVLGPDQLRDGWRVLKVMDLRERSPRTFEEAYQDVRDDWGNLDSERRMRELMKTLMASAIVNVNRTSSYLTGRKRMPR